MLRIEVTKDLNTIKIIDEIPSPDLLPEIIARILDAIITENSINISEKRKNVTEEEKKGIIITERIDVLEKAKDIPVRLDIITEYDDGLQQSL